MGRRCWSVDHRFLLALRLSCLFLLTMGSPLIAVAQSGPPADSKAAPPTEAKKVKPKQTLSVASSAAQPVDVTADRLEFINETESYDAVGSVVLVQGLLRLTADHVTIKMLTGALIAEGRVHLKDPASDLWSERLELDVNTDAGVVANGTLFMKDSNTLVTGRLLQRFSEDYYRAKDGSFTNCDAQGGQVPAWRFTFKDMDLNAGESLYAKNLWFCINDVPLVPFPALSYPIQTARKSGLLIPETGYDTKFGGHYRQVFFWALSPSQDVMITPDYKSRRGYGGDLEYRYIIDRHSKGQWLLTTIKDNVTHTDRAVLTGSHTQQVTPDLSIRSKANLLSDRNYYNNLANSGALRATPSAESNLNINQRFANGDLYFLGQYLTPVGAGGQNTFQRLPEIGHNLVNVAPFGGLVLGGMESAFVYFRREEGFNLSRVDLMPTFSTDTLSLGHVVGLTPRLNLREVVYTRGATTGKPVHRETFWASLDATSRLTRQFSRSGGGSLLHTIEPDVIYEFVPPTDQSKIVQIDAVDDLTKKNLVTYSVRSRLLELGNGGAASNWVDITLAQSYHPGAVQSQARSFALPGSSLFGSTTQQIQPTMTAVQGKKFSDLWARAVFGNTVGVAPGKDPLSLTLDSFFDPYRGNFSQWNTDLRYQQSDRWYVEVGQRYTRDGNRVRRGDIWNPISFNEVFAPTPTVQFATMTGAVRLPYGVTVGAKTYYDIKTGTRPETDLVGVYQNPCRCWSLGLYYIQFPDRTQVNFLVSLTGIGATEADGTALMKTILHPLLKDEKGLPWPTSPTSRTSTASSSTASPAAPGFAK
ncbi:MAG: LPS-assembly protein LptD [Nitrospira sp.]|nr:LPS-assembly protein LptD [Nitrospira sp.]